jgi:hypothetical protein
MSTGESAPDATLAMSLVHQRLEQAPFSAFTCFLNGLPFVASGTEAKNGGQGGIASAMLRPS